MTEAEERELRRDYAKVMAMYVACAVAFAAVMTVGRYLWGGAW